jgi:hypothetical protein
LQKSNQQYRLFLWTLIVTNFVTILNFSSLTKYIFQFENMIKNLYRSLCLYMIKRDPVYKRKEYCLFTLLFYYFILLIITFIACSLFFLVILFLLINSYMFSPHSTHINPVVGACIIAYRFSLPSVYLIVSIQETYRIFIKKLPLSRKRK